MPRMRALTWLFRAFLFFVLFAFALNNQHEVNLKWFFGHETQAPMVFVVLAAFVLGCTCGVLAMVPSWWRQRRAARTSQGPGPAPAAPTPTPLPASTGDALVLNHPPRDGV
jgi:lipopolysaccharide assembly protein A